MKPVKALGSALEKALVGSESHTPEIKRFIDKYIHSTGRAKDLPSKRSKLLSLAIGNEHSPNVIKSRYLSDGLFGPGGLLLGEIAPSQEYIDLLTRTINSKGGNIIDPETGKAITKGRSVLKLIGKTPLEALNPALTVGLPIIDVGSALRAKPGDENYGARGVGSAIGSGIGFAVTAPIGLAGGLLGGHIGSTIGGALGGMFSDSETQARARESSLQANNLKPIIRAAADIMFDPGIGSSYNYLDRVVNTQN